MNRVGRVYDQAGNAYVEGGGIERRVADPMLPLSLLQRRLFLGGNLVRLLACKTSWGAVFFVAGMRQATLGQSPLVAGLLLAPIDLVLMVGAPLAGKVADRSGCVSSRKTATRGGTGE